MDRTLRFLGLAILAVTAWLALAGEFGWVASAMANSLVEPMLWVGAGCFGAGLALRVFSPIGRRMRRRRCARCSATIEHGQTYCHDHMRQAVNEYQDHARRGY